MEKVASYGYFDLLQFDQSFPVMWFYLFKLYLDFERSYLMNLVRKLNLCSAWIIRML